MNHLQGALLFLSFVFFTPQVHAEFAEAHEHDFGRVVLGQSVEKTFTACEDHPETYNYVGTAMQSGSPDFQIVSDTCSNSVVGPGQCCSVTIRFTPSSVTPLKSQPIKGFFSIYNLEVWDPPTPPPPGSETEWEEYITLDASGEGVPALLPIIRNCPGNCAGVPIKKVPARVPANSSINIHTLALEEQIPLVGVPFSLSYTSDLRRIRLGPKIFGLGGWVPSVMHYYDPDDKVLYMGDGSAIAVEARPFSNGYYIASPSGRELYFFDQNGFHKETRDSLQGLIIYSFTYQSQGRILAIADRFSNQTTFTYVGSMVTITSPYGQTTNLTMDANGFLSSLVNSLNETWSFQHNSSGFLLEKTKPQGQTSHLTYDEFGFIKKDLGQRGDYLEVLRAFDVVTGKQSVTLTTAEGRQTVFESTATTTEASSHKMISSSGYVLSDSRQTQGPQTSTDATGVVSSSTVLPDPRFGVMSSYTSDSSMQVPGSGVDIRAATTLNAVLSIPSNPLSPLVSLTETTVLQNNSARTYNKITTSQPGGKLKREFISPLNRKVTENYNALGLLESLQSGDLTPVIFSYDSRGRLAETNQGLRKTQLSYDSFGNVEKITNALNQDTRFAYDGANRLIQKIFPDLRTVQYTYDKNGNITSVTTPKNVTHSFSLNASELMSSYVAPSAPGNTNYTTTYEYNLDNQLKKIVRPGNDPISFEYSPATGALNKIVTPTGNYDIVTDPAKGLPTQISSPSGLKTKFSYAGPFVSKEELLNAQNQVLGSYERTFSGDVVSSDIVRGSDGNGISISYQYDNDGNVIQAGSLSLTYNQNGQLAGTSLGTGATQVTDSYTYNSFGEMLEYEAKQGGVTVYKLALERDNLGRITKKTQTLRGTTTVWDYTYDSSGRLTDTLKNGVAYAQYVYDNNGNRIGGFIGSQTTTAAYDSQDRLVTYNSYSYTYKPNGFLYRKLNTITGYDNSYVYDSLGNLRKFYSGDVPFGVYDYDGRDRIARRYVNGQVDRHWIYKDQYHIAGELNSSGIATHRYVYASKTNVPDYLIAGNQTYRIISDHLGSFVLLLPLTSGYTGSWKEYDEFGRVLTSYNPIIPFGFAGGFDDGKSKLVRFGARDYDPEVGRWTAKDPILFDGGDTNLFGYVQNDPINFVDPRGLWALQIGGSISGLIGPIIGVGGSAESGIAVSYSSQYGFQVAGYQSAGVRAGTGLFGGLSLNLSLTPGAQRVSDLNGGGITKGFDTPIVGGSMTTSGGTCGSPEMNTYTLGIGPGVIGDAYWGATGTWVGAPLTFGGR